MAEFLQLICIGAKSGCTRLGETGSPFVTKASALYKGSQISSAQSLMSQWVVPTAVVLFELSHGVAGHLPWLCCVWPHNI